MWLWIAIGLIIFFGFMAFTGAPYVPTMPREVKRAFRELRPLSADDVLVDIGSGDGVVLRTASRYGARAVGYEINPALVLVSKWWSRGDSNVSVHLANFWNVSFPDDTTVVYTFGDDRDIKRMYAKVAEEASRIGRPLAFITYGFVVGERRPDKSAGAHHLYLVNPIQKNSVDV